MVELEVQKAEIVVEEEVVVVMEASAAIELVVHAVASSYLRVHSNPLR